MQQEITFVVNEDPEGSYVAYALGHSIVTEADDEASLREMVRDAVRCHFDDDDEERPRLIHLHYVKDEVIQA